MGIFWDEIMVYIYAFLIILDYLAFCDFVRCGENEDKTKINDIILGFHTGFNDVLCYSMSN